MINIVGAGISGLALGYFLKKSGQKIRIFEASSKAGGVISTEFVPQGMIQHGPHLMKMNHTLEVLLQELNIETTSLKYNKRYIANTQNGFHIGFPLTFWEIAKAAILQFRARKSFYTSLSDFIVHHYGKAVAKKLIQPLANGVYAENVENLDAEIAFSSVYFHEKRAIYRTLKVLLQKFYSKKYPVVAPLNGFQAIIDALATYLHEDIAYNTKIEDISSLDGSVFITIPAFEASKLRGISKETSRLLSDITYSSLAITTIFTENSIGLEGVGFLSNANNGVIGTLFNSSSFENRAFNYLHSYSVFSKNIEQGKVENFIKNTFKVKLQKLYFKSYKNAVPVYDKTIKSFIQHNNTLKERYRFFSNYTGNSAIGKIVEEAKKIAKSGIFS